MKYSWIDAYLLSKRGVTKDLQADWNWVRYRIGDKMFAAVCLDHSVPQAVSPISSLCFLPLNARRQHSRAREEFDGG